MTSAPTTAEKPRRADAPPRARRKGWASARYYVCVALLVVSAVGMKALAGYLGGHFRKAAVELKRPLTEFDWRKLAPRYRPHRIQPRLPNEETLQALGTDECLQVRLVDTTREGRDSTAVANVFITYYTGQPDMVPHVPEECYLAGGYDPANRPETVNVRVTGVGAPNDEIPVRLLQFQSQDGRNRPTVMYFFHTNGHYETTRTRVRLRLARLSERFAYYAKIEVNFTNDSDDPRVQRHAEREASVEALQSLLQRLMPVLLEDHLAWDLVQSGQYVATEE